MAFLATVIHGEKMYSHSFLDVSGAGSFSVSHSSQVWNMMWFPVGCSVGSSYRDVTNIGHAASVGPSRDENEQFQQNCKAKDVCLWETAIGLLFSPLCERHSLLSFLVSGFQSSLLIITGKGPFMSLSLKHKFAVTKSAPCFRFACISP